MGPLVDHLVALGFGRSAAFTLALLLALGPGALPARAAPTYALAAYSAAEGGEPFPVVAAGLTVGLAWLPVVGPAIGYTYAGEPIRGAWVGVGQLTAGGAGWLAGYFVGALVSPLLPVAPGTSPEARSQAAADQGGAYGTLAALVAYTLWTAVDVYRLAELRRM